MTIPRSVFGATFKAVTGVFALDNGNIQIEGHADVGPVEIEIPGECVRLLITTMSALLPKVRPASPEGRKSVFQVTQVQVTTSEFPDHAQLNLTVAPDDLFPFSLPTSMLDEIGQYFLNVAAEVRKAQIQSGQKPQ